LAGEDFDEVGWLLETELVGDGRGGQVAVAEKTFGFEGDTGVDARSCSHR
jgi:hypothetical protein